MADLDPAVVGVVLGMALVTYATKAGGLWALGRVDVSPRVEAALDALPGALVVAILVPRLLAAGAPGYVAGAAVALVAWRTERVLLALVVGVVAVVSLRTMV